MAIRWQKTPLAKLKGDGIYAKSEDGRFLIFARRWRHGQPGDRKYAWFFSAVDYHTPSGGHRYSNVPVPGGGQEQSSVNVDKVLAAVEKWAAEHPPTAKEPDKTAARVVARFLVAQAPFQVGDSILYGKYKNKHGIIVRIFDDAKGHPTLEIEPVPKGRKQNKEIGLYKIWPDPNPPTPGAVQAGSADDDWDDHDFDE